MLALYCKHQPKPLTGKVNQIDYLVTVASVSGGIYEAISEPSVLKFDVLEAGKIGKHKDLRPKCDG